MPETDWDATLELFMPWDADGPVMHADGEDGLLLELKSANAVESGEDLRAVLNDLTKELKAQFKTFKAIRLAAEKVLTDAEDDNAAKLAKADIKTASDAINQIVRTLEKVDNLQRSLADADATAAGGAIDEAEVETMRNQFMALIEERAMELAAERGADGVGAGTGPPDPGG